MASLGSSLRVDDAPVQLYASHLFSSDKSLPRAGKTAPPQRNLPIDQGVGAAGHAATGEAMQLFALNFPGVHTVFVAESHH